MEWKDICTRDQAFNAAFQDLLDGQCKIVDERLMNCLKYGTPHDLSEGCIKKLLKAYGR